MFTDNGGKVTNTDNWGKRKLAYAIAKNEYAVYVFYTVELPSEAVQKIEAALNITDEVIRFLITRVDIKGIAKAEAAKAEKARRAAERGESPDAPESSKEDAQNILKSRVEVKKANEGARLWHEA